MRITSIPQIYHHVNRWREILSVLSRYGLANWIGRLGPEFAKDLFRDAGGEAIARHPWRARVRMAMAELGPTFIKLGQLLSTRPDMVGMEMATELQQLQENVPADLPETVRALIAQELGQPVDKLFSDFHEHAMASASIGQVHRARLVSGQAVVIKVQHADIQHKVEVDLDILAGMATLAERIPEFRNFRPRAMVAEFRRSLRRELDFERELRNIQQFARDFGHDPTVRIPTVYPELSSARVLTMELLEGTKLSDIPGLTAAGIDPDQVAHRGADIFLAMIFANGFYHADPHPGNILLMDGSVIGLLDFGMVGRIDEQLQEDITEMLLAITNLDAEHLTSIVMRVGSVPPELDRAALSLDVADFVNFYANQSLDRFDIAGALTEMTEIFWRYGIMLPARLALLIKVLVTLDGTVRQLSPKCSLMELMGPYRRRLLMQRLSPGRQMRKLRRLYSELEHLLRVLPRGLSEIIDQVQTGRFDIHLDHRGLEPSVNRLVLGMMTSALFLGSTLLLSRQVWPVFHEVSIFGALGAALSLVLGLRLWQAIRKSGRLDRQH